MTDTFRVGEVAIYVRPGSQRFGEEVIVKMGLGIRGGGKDHVTGGTAVVAMKYGIEFSDGCIRGALPEWLRRKNPPQRELDQIVSWDDCLWKPEVVTA